ncbi:MAG: YggS family pyridoxal phosphate-dependent enzyme [Burkholderiaceae bacterium]
MSVTSNNLQGVRQRIRDAVEAAQRAVDSVTLIAVTKTFPASAVLDVLADGQRDFGENYLQEAVDKIVTVAATLEDWRSTSRSDAAVLEPVWHFIGPIQSNKTRAIATRFDWVHSVDRLKIAERLSTQRDPDRDPLNVLIEVNLDREATKSGVAPVDVAALAHAIAGLPRLRLRGLMTVPAPRTGHAAQRAVFAELRVLAERLRSDGLPCEHLSMGMSADLEAAIAEGATMVRVGTAIFGVRPATMKKESP